MTCQTCQFYRLNSCRRRSPSATGWPFVQPDDTCGEWEAAVTIPEAMQQLGETIGKIRDVVGVAPGWEPPAPLAPPPNVIVGRDAEVRLEPMPEAKQPVNQWRDDRMPMAADANDDGCVWGLLEGGENALIHHSWWAGRSDVRTWAPGHLPAPTDPPPGWEPLGIPAPADTKPPTPPAPRWIVDRLPTAEDGDKDGDVAISARPGVPGHYTAVSRRYIHPGTPWAPTDAIPDEPFNPTTLDRNGWIRSRLPGEGDVDRQIDRDGEVLVPAHGLESSDRWAWIKAAFVVPGQPWAPAGSEPEEYWP